MDIYVCFFRFKIVFFEFFSFLDFDINLRISVGDINPVGNGEWGPMMGIGKETDGEFLNGDEG